MTSVGGEYVKWSVMQCKNTVWILQTKNVFSYVKILPSLITNKNWTWNIKKCFTKINGKININIQTKKKKKTYKHSLQVILWNINQWWIEVLHSQTCTKHVGEKHQIDKQQQEELNNNAKKNETLHMGTSSKRHLRLEELRNKRNEQ